MTGEVVVWTEPDLRGLTPLFWSNVALHGTFELDVNKRIDYDRGPTGIEASPGTDLR